MTELARSIYRRLYAQTLYNIYMIATLLRLDREV